MTALDVPPTFAWRQYLKRSKNLLFRFAWDGADTVQNGQIT